MSRQVSLRYNIMILNNGLQWNPCITDTLGPLRCVLIREVFSFQGVNNTYLYGSGVGNLAPIPLLTTKYLHRVEKEYVTGSG